MASDEKLSPRRRIFVQCFRGTRNATRAALEAGYGGGKREEAAKEGSRLLRVPEIRRALDDLTQLNNHPYTDYIIVRNGRTKPKAHQALVPGLLP